MDGGDTRESPDSSAQSKSPRTLRNFMHGNRETSGASEPETGTDRREKAESRTARMHAPEESDRGVVPKNRSNNEAQAKTEGEEGRPRIKENASPTHTHPTQSGEWVSQGLAGVRQALTPSIRDKSRMREICSYGSVRGVAGDRYPYRDPSNTIAGGTSNRRRSVMKLPLPSPSTHL
jgi:hypothetical protein